MANQSEKRQAGTTEIEVSPAMIEAAFIFLDEEWPYDFDPIPSRLVEGLYRAMEASRLGRGSQTAQCPRGASPVR